jgi:radical SAM superfamily enzyme YgiQ (UPF0313 family)
VVSTSRPATVVLVNPNRMRPPIAPVGLDYVAAALEERGHRPMLLDLCWPDDWRAEIAHCFEQVRPDLIGFSIRNMDDCYMASQEHFGPLYREMADALRAASPAPIVVGGVGFSVMPEAALDLLGAEYGIVGDGEQALAEIADCLAAGQGFADVPGLVWRGDGGYRINAPVPVPGEAIPSRRRFADNARYFAEGGQGGVETKRGCPSACIYCADPVAKGRTYRLRPPERVADEFEGLLDQGVTHIHLCDSEFNLPPDHAEAVCCELSRRGLQARMRWYTYAAPAPFTRRLARLMAEAGCAGVNFGADRGDAEMLKRLGRSHTPDDIAAAARLCREHGIPVMFDLLVGGPGETRESAAETVGLMKQVDPDVVGLSVGVRVWPHTPMAEIVRREGLSAENRTLHGRIEGNADFIWPIYYLSSELGDGIGAHLDRLVAGDSRFFVADVERSNQNYNYNENLPLINSIRAGAYWDILRRMRAP